nr:ROK family protein [Sphingobium sp. Sx8-8]
MGGTKTIVLLARNRHILREETLPTTDPDTTLKRASALLRRWFAAEPFLALGIASFGPLDLCPGSRTYGHMLPTPKQSWSGANIGGALSAELPCAVLIDTDVNGAALAEMRWGAGVQEAADSLCYITVGTGVGGGFIVNGRPLHGAMHPEIGHIRVSRAVGDDFGGICPFHSDCIEGLVSGPALAARFGMPGDRISPDDPRWAYVVHELAQFVCSILLMTSVRMVLIGGGVAMARPELMERVRAQVVVQLAGYLPFVSANSIERIVRAPELGAKAGPLGAIALALDADSAWRTSVPHQRENAL